MLKYLKENLWWLLILGPIPLAIMNATYHIYNRIQPYNFFTMYTIGSITITLILSVICVISFLKLSLFKDQPFSKIIVRYCLALLAAPTLGILATLVSYHGTIVFLTFLRNLLK